MKGVILAGGKGTRLRPLTCNLPKPMLPLLNKPVMEYSLELLKQHGIEEIAVTVQYMGNAIQNYFGDGSKWGVKLHYFEDSPPLGTAGSVKQAEAFLDEPFVVISGDALTDFQLSRGMDFHRTEERLVTIFLKEVSHPLDFGLAVTEEDGRIVKYIEKPGWNEVVSNTVNTGIYIMNPEIFSYMERHMFYDFSHDIFPRLLEEKKNIYGYLSDGYWLDIGTFPQYRQAHFDLLMKKVNVQLPFTEVLPTVWMGTDVTIEDGTKIKGPLLIGDGAVVKSGALIEPYSIIGKNNIIGENTHVQKTILWNDVYVGKQCELTGTTVASGTVIEDGSTLFEKSIVADHCKLGKNTVVKAKIKVAPGKIIEGSSVLSSSLMSEQENALSLLQRGTAAGRANLDITPEFIVKLAAAYGSIFPLHSSILIGGDWNPYSQLMKQAFMSGLHAAGIHTMECQPMSESCFRYAALMEDVAGGVFLSVLQHEDEEKMIVRFYDQDGYPISVRMEKEIESIYMSELYRHVSVTSIGINAEANINEEQYVYSLLRSLNRSLIRNEKFHLLVNKTENPFHNIVLSFLQLLGCSLTWVYSQANESHIKSLMQSSKADVGIIFHEQGRMFELYDSFGNVYKSIGQENVAIPDILLHQGEGVLYPLLLKHGASYVICSVKEEHQGGEFTHKRFEHDSLYRIGKLLELIASRKQPLHGVFEQYPQCYLFWDEVVCPWGEKGRVMRMLLADMQNQEMEVMDGIRFQYENGDWSYIVSDLSQPKLIVYSQSSNPETAKEKNTHLIEKIRQYQKV